MKTELENKTESAGGLISFAFSYMSPLFAYVILGRLIAIMNTQPPDGVNVLIVWCAALFFAVSQVEMQSSVATINYSQLCGWTRNSTAAFLLCWVLHVVLNGVFFGLWLRACIYVEIVDTASANSACAMVSTLIVVVWQFYHWKWQIEALDAFNHLFE